MLSLPASWITVRQCRQKLFADRWRRLPRLPFHSPRTFPERPCSARRPLLTPDLLLPPSQWEAIRPSTPPAAHKDRALAEGARPPGPYLRRRAGPDPRAPHRAAASPAKCRRARRLQWAPPDRAAVRRPDASDRSG